MKGRNLAVAEFTRDLAHLVRIGMPLDKALDFVARQASHPALRESAMEMAQSVRRGETLSGAVKAQGSVFGRLNVHVVGLGERSECLPDILERLSDYLDASRRFRDRAWDAMIYPMITLLFCLMVTGFLRTYILPTFVIVDEAMSPHPLFPLAVSVLEAASGVALTLSVLLALPVADRLRWHLPWFGSLWRHAGMAGTCRSLALALGSGASIPQALRMAADAESNGYLRASLWGAADKVERGLRLSEALRESPCFPPHLVETVTAGEQSESLPEALTRAGNMHEQMLENSMTSLVLLLEPAALLFVGLFVALACLAFWYPFYHWVTIIR